MVITRLGSQLFCGCREKPGQYQFVFEFMDGGSLDRYIEKIGGLDAVLFKSIWIQVMKALEHLHDKVDNEDCHIHHDLKAEQ